MIFLKKFLLKLTLILGILWGVTACDNRSGSFDAAGLLSIPPNPSLGSAPKNSDSPASQFEGRSKKPNTTGFQDTQGNNYTTDGDEARSSRSAEELFTGEEQQTQHNIQLADSIIDVKINRLGEDNQQLRLGTKKLFIEVKATFNNELEPITFEVNLVKKGKAWIFLPTESLSHGEKFKLSGSLEDKETQHKTFGSLRLSAQVPETDFVAKSILDFRSYLASTNLRIPRDVSDSSFVQSQLQTLQNTYSWVTNIIVTGRRSFYRYDILEKPRTDKITLQKIENSELLFHFEGDSFETVGFLFNDVSDFHSNPDQNKVLAQEAKLFGSDNYGMRSFQVFLESGVSNELQDIILEIREENPDFNILELEPEVLGSPLPPAPPYLRAPVQTPQTSTPMDPTAEPQNNDPEENNADSYEFDKAVVDAITPTAPPPVDPRENVGPTQPQTPPTEVASQIMPSADDSPNRNQPPQPLLELEPEKDLNVDPETYVKPEPTRFELWRERQKENISRMKYNTNNAWLRLWGSDPNETPELDEDEETPEDTVLPIDGLQEIPTTLNQKEADKTPQMVFDEAPEIPTIDRPQSPEVRASADNEVFYKVRPQLRPEYWVALQTNDGGCNTQNRPDMSVQYTYGLSDDAFLSIEADEEKYPAIYSGLRQMEKNYTYPCVRKKISEIIAKENKRKQRSLSKRWTFSKFWTVAQPLRQMISDVFHGYDVLPTLAYVSAVESTFLKNPSYPLQVSGAPTYTSSNSSTAFGPFQILKGTAQSLKMRTVKTQTSRTPPNASWDERYYFASGLCGAAKHMLVSYAHLGQIDVTWSILSYFRGDYGAAVWLAHSLWDYPLGGSNKRTQAQNRKVMNLYNVVDRYTYTYQEIKGYGKFPDYIRNYVDLKVAAYFILQSPTAMGFPIPGDALEQIPSAHQDKFFPELEMLDPICENITSQYREQFSTPAQNCESVHGANSYACKQNPSKWKTGYGF